MFDQITNLHGHEWYLIFSLSVFMVFFIVVGVMLFYMKKDHTDLMSRIPLADNDNNTEFNLFNPWKDEPADSH